MMARQVGPDHQWLLRYCDDNESLMINRIAVPEFDHPEPERREWWLALMRGLPLASSWLPKYW